MGERLKPTETRHGTRGASKTETERAREKGGERMASQARFPRGARSGTTGDGLQARARLDNRAVWFWRKKDEGELDPSLLVRDGAGT